LVESDSELRISSVIRSWWAKRSSTNKNWKKLKKSWVSSKSRILVPMVLRIKFSAESVGARRRTTQTPWSLHANVKVLSVWSTSNAWRIGYWHRSKRNHQMLKTKTSDPSTGNVLSVRFANKCTLIPSKSNLKYTRSSTSRSKWIMITTTSC
jgi:hypothetical protein